MKKFREMLGIKPAKRGRKSVIGGTTWMRAQMTKMTKMNQGIVSGIMK